MTKTVLVLVLTLFASTVVAGVVYEDAEGWSFEVIEAVPYTEQLQWREFEPSWDRMAAMRGYPPGYMVYREMSRQPSDYFWCALRLECSFDVAFGPRRTFVAVLKDSTRVAAVRLLFVDAPPERQKRLFDTSHEIVNPCARDADGDPVVGWTKKDGVWAVPVCLQFPYDTVGAVDKIKRLVYPEGGESACADTSLPSASSSLPHLQLPSSR